LPDVARLLLAEKKLDATLELRGIFFDGDVYAGEEGVKTVGSFPTREEAISGIVGALLGAGGGVISAVGGPGAAIASILSAIEEKKQGTEESEPAAAPAAGEPAAGGDAAPASA
jgi:ribosomal protein L10